MNGGLIWDAAATSFDPATTIERRDGNATNEITLFKRPALECIGLTVETPILGYTRVYTPEEIKTYVKQGIIKVFTYKLA